MMPRQLIERLFGAATIQRWNDHIRPVELTELDKQAHKAMILFLLAKFEEDRRGPLDWGALIDGFIFEFLPRVVLTDIKAPFFHRLMKSNGEAVNKHVLKVLGPELGGLEGDLLARFSSYLEQDGARPLERRILSAAHYLATQWEFRLVYQGSPFMYGIERTKTEIENQLEDYIDLIGVQKVSLKQKAYGFVDLCGQLRFQQRWAQTPRMPRTSVLGHSLFVAILAYLIGAELKACPARRRNNFLVALFHDLPEVFTRDIISPIKRSIEGLEAFIEQEERYLVNDRLLPLLPDAWHDEVRYYVERPFESRIREEGRRRTVAAAELNGPYNADRFAPVDGEVIKGCDELAAFIEASKSIEHGIKSPQLIDGARALLEKYGGRPKGPVDLSYCFDYFRAPVEAVR